MDGWIGIAALAALVVCLACAAAVMLALSATDVSARPRDDWET